MTLSAGSRLGPYEILVPIGAGGLAVVEGCVRWAALRAAVIGSEIQRRGVALTDDRSPVVRMPERLMAVVALTQVQQFPPVSQAPHRYPVHNLLRQPELPHLADGQLPQLPLRLVQRLISPLAFQQILV